MAKTKQLDQYELTFHGKPGVAKLEEFTPDEIGRLLAVLPKTIYAYAVDAKKKLKVYQEQKSATKQVRAKKWLESIVLKAKNELTSEGDRKAWVENEQEVIDAEVKEIIAQSEYEFAEILVTHADNLFIAVRKAAQLIEKQAAAARNDERYGTGNS